MIKGLIAPVAAGLAIGLLVAGCGDGGGDATSISKVEFVKKADSVCADTGERVRSQFAAFVASYGGKEPEGAALRAAQRKIVETVLVPNKRREIEQLRDIGTPAGGEAQLSAILAKLELGIEEAEAHPTETVTGAAEPFAQAEKQAVAYGLTGC